MSPSAPPFHLWIAADDSTTVVALAPLKISRAPLRYEWGSITDLRAVPVLQRPPNVAGVIVLATLTLIGAWALFLSGMPPLAVFVLAVLVLGLGSAAMMSEAAPPQVVAPERAAFPALHLTLHTKEERREFLGLVGLAERAGRALPAVAKVIEPAEGGRLIAQALWEAANVLSRRQQLRPRVVRQQQLAPNAPPSSPAAQALAEQRNKAWALWEETEAELARIQTALELAAIAAENVADDPSALITVRETYRELAELYGERI
ncbi:hypothetical protein ABZ671_14015 [Micromonospora sp. NPDC006766]|uniref:hypothetical protein n=1 Tax=Micromonospora sp. NPDC006766 TaxID=3154778 RepID=UPI0033E3DE76